MKIFFNLNDLMQYTAKYLVAQSPYPVPTRFEVALHDLVEVYTDVFEFNEKINYGYVRFEAINTENVLDRVFEKVPSVARYNEPESGHDCKTIFTSRYFSPKADDDFIDLSALARNIVNGIMKENKEIGCL